MESATYKDFFSFRDQFAGTSLNSQVQKGGLRGKEGKAPPGAVFLGRGDHPRERQLRTPEWSIWHRSNNSPALQVEAEGARAGICVTSARYLTSVIQK
jgi:hypothetical protein